MTERSIELEVGDDVYDGELTVPDEPTSQGVVVLPGASHGPYGGVFDRFTEEATERGFHVLRYESWEEPEEIQAKTLGEAHEEFDAATALLESEGCENVAVVGKSFGGGLAFTHVPDGVDRMVLWAPAMRVGPRDAVDELKDVPLGELHTPPVGPGTLHVIDVPVRIVQGDEDEVQSVDASRELVDELPNGDLEVVGGMDHSFDDEEWGAEVVESTMAWLTE